MIVLTLEGLEAHNPLGFLAALGLLRVLDHHAAATGGAPPRLGFVDHGRFVARLVTSHSLDDVIDIVMRDAAAQADNRALQFAYDDAGNVVPPTTKGASHDLKPPPAAAHALLDHAATAGPRTAELAAAWFSDLVKDRGGNTKPTAFHFTAGQQAFLDMVEELRQRLTADHVREAVLGPWLNTSPLPSLSWDASVARMYALRAGNPSKEKRGSVPGANWLAVLGLAYFPVVARRGRLLTTGIVGGWKDSVFTWPVWSAAGESSAIASLLRLDPAAWTHDQRTIYGIDTVFRCRILRSDQGGYGSFTPAAVIPPAR
jgi:hypothetical protein